MCIYIKCQVCGSKCKKCKSSDLSWLVWCLMIVLPKKKKVAACQKPCAVIPADEYAWRCLNCFTGDYSYVSGYVTATLQQSTACIIDCLSEAGVLLCEPKSLSEVVYTLGFYTRGII